jgi:hypothetical protein
MKNEQDDRRFRIEGKAFCFQLDGESRLLCVVGYLRWTPKIGQWYKLLETL